MKQRSSKVLALVIIAAGFIMSSVVPVSANHSWGNYHWARTSNPFTLKLGDNVAGVWDPYLAEASTDWSKPVVPDVPDVLDTTIVAGQSDRRCKPSSGRVEVCAEKYGYNGWLGLASLWASGDHITQATVKMNDSYFNTSTYNTPAWRRSVMCQEVGHVFGLAHQDENFGNPNLGSCMDYTSRPAGTGPSDPSNEHPNAHDYDQLETIYGHGDGTTTISAASTTDTPNRSTTQEPRPALEGAGPDHPADFGRPVGPKDGHGRDILFVRDVGNGQQLFTWVKWADPGQPGS